MLFRNVNTSLGFFTENDAHDGFGTDDTITPHPAPFGNCHSSWNASSSVWSSPKYRLSTEPGFSFAGFASSPSCPSR